MLFQGLSRAQRPALSAVGIEMNTASPSSTCSACLDLVPTLTAAQLFSIPNLISPHFSQTERMSVFNAWVRARWNSGRPALAQTTCLHIFPGPPCTWSHCRPSSLRLERWFCPLVQQKKAGSLHFHRFPGSNSVSWGPGWFCWKSRK